MGCGGEREGGDDDIFLLLFETESFFEKVRELGGTVENGEGMGNNEARREAVSA